MAIKILEGPPPGTPAGAVPTVQADGTTDYVVPTVASTIDDTTTSTSKTWSSTKTAAAIAAVAVPGEATTTSEGVIQLAGDLAGTGLAPVLKVLAGLTAGTYGAATSVPVVTVDAKGRVTGITTTPSSGMFFYDPVNGWPAYPSTIPVVLFSVGYPSAPAPTGAANNSIWFYST
jgi:hypothetical protein